MDGHFKVSFGQSQRQTGFDLVNRDLVKTHLRKVLGEKASLFVIPEFQSEFNYADLLKMREENSKYD